MAAKTETVEMDTATQTVATKKSTSPKKTTKTTDNEKTPETKKTDSAKSTTKSKTTTKSTTAKSSTKADTKATTAKTATKSTSKTTTKSTSSKTATTKDVVSKEAVSKETTPQETPSKATTPKETVAKDNVSKEESSQKTSTVDEIKLADVEVKEETETKKARNKYAVMLVKEHEDGAITTHHIGTALCEFILGTLFVIILICACLIVYDSVSLKKLKSEVVNQIVQINDLTEQNEILSVENDSLSSKVSVLSETVSKKAATEEAMTQEETENAIPKGFPLSGGTSSMSSGTDGNDPILLFDASTGINIVSSGTGSVIAIEDDADYGHRIIIDHGNGYRSIYRNSGEPLVKVGDTLGKGYILFSIADGNEKIGYQIMVDNQYVDPMEVIEING